MMNLHSLPASRSLTLPILSLSCLSISLSYALHPGEEKEGKLCTVGKRTRMTHPGGRPLPLANVKCKKCIHAYFFLTVAQRFSVVTGAVCQAFFLATIAANHGIPSHAICPPRHLSWQRPSPPDVKLNI